MTKLELSLSSCTNSMDDEIKRQKESEILGVTEVFPESRDFDFLLKNKFET